MYVSVQVCTDARGQIWVPHAHTIFGDKISHQTLKGLAGQGAAALGSQAHTSISGFFSRVLVTASSLPAETFISPALKKKKNFF